MQRFDGGVRTFARDATCVQTLVRAGFGAELVAQRVHMAAGAVGLVKCEAQLLGEGFVAFLCLCPLSPSKHSHTPEHTYSITHTYTHPLYHSHRSSIPVTDSS